jgi:peptide chain release factor
MEKIIQITSGTGPAECSWVVAQVLKMLLIDAKTVGLQAIVLHKMGGELNRTLDSVTIQLNGESEKLKAFLVNWIGTIQWVGQSQFRKYHKRKNWFIGVNELDLSKSTISFNENEVKYSAIRSGGPGGQHVNKVSTAIRATHIPTGLSVVVSDTRSQLQNKKKAKECLINLLRTAQLNEQKDLIKANWQNHNELERGNPVKIFKGNDFKNEFTVKNHKAKRKKLKQDFHKNNYLYHYEL